MACGLECDRNGIGDMEIHKSWNNAERRFTVVKCFSTETQYAMFGLLQLIVGCELVDNDLTNNIIKILRKAKQEHESIRQIERAD